MPDVRLVDEQGEQLGVMPTRQALEIADDRGYDLVEVAPAARPPACRLMDFESSSMRQHERNAKPAKLAGAGSQMSYVKCE